ncbi:MAG TPA: alpha/beta hydrolase [Solirubrobacteraceae bacterium]|nr:alpha/beta hydrolase [Solirubrobacteraceae bacterium]
MPPLEAPDPDEPFVGHELPEHQVDLGEVRMNYAVAGEDSLPALLLVPAQIESWWGYEPAIELLRSHFQVFAVDLRGQGRSTRTPGRYTLDNMGNDLVRFIDEVIARPVLVSGNSSGGVLAAWLSAYAPPGRLRGAICEDPPLFASEVNPACGHSIRQSLGPMFALINKWLGDQWSIGDWDGMQAAAPREVPPYVLQALARMRIIEPPDPAGPAGPPQNFREYDPEWARSFWTGAASAACDHERMLRCARVPILITHHYRELDSATGALMGAVSDEQVARARALIQEAGQPCEVVDLPDAAHAIHRHDPRLFARIVMDWSARTEAGSPARTEAGSPARTEARA